ncbi:MAG: sulfite oxidase-like oxidoreductase, partial [Nanoarchaeota archaeon]
NKIEFMKENKPGFWEVRGYHLRGDAKLEERYS